ncbi:N-methyl-L-tryptophan oxidase [Microvirga guangxiensis]|uniref:Sarcosine oxidase n=1 Tax=Microvirga guangxiensis TaxID=549386 RepID=A0A1G5LKD5_9HYPH|nr:N-methyl-L-tryptophan oxidase [Microvirga guangxiensis]SCZ12690.1 sarcosine oxidase [Microvirga guangxiensis]
MRTFDTIVIGVGGMGSATLWQLARPRQKVLGIERFDLGHGMGSSHGINRIIRLAYFEHPNYVPLLVRAYELWREAEQLTKEQLLFITGGIDAGTEDSRIVQGALTACREHNLSHEVLTARETTQRFPGYKLPDSYAVIYQPDAGFVASERAILAHASLAVSAGAEIHGREKVVAIEPVNGRVVVVTDQGRYEAGKVVVSAGSWISDLIPALRTNAVPERQVLGWFLPQSPDLFKPEVFPVSNILSQVGHFYQFPMWGIPGFKIGLYHHFNEKGHADQLSREPTPADEEALRKGIKHMFPDADGPTLRLAACLFTNTPDEHFVIDTLPGTPEIVVASPCSGHGFKFASVIGEVLADLVTLGKSKLDLSLFGMNRFEAPTG